MLNANALADYKDRLSRDGRMERGMELNKLKGYPGHVTMHVAWKCPFEVHINVHSYVSHVTITNHT